MYDDKDDLHLFFTELTEIAKNSLFDIDEICRVAAGINSGHMSLELTDWDLFFQIKKAIKKSNPSGSDPNIVVSGATRLHCKYSNTNSMPLATTSQWLTANANIGDLLQQQGTFSIHTLNRDQGFPMLDLKPFLGLTEPLFHPDVTKFVGRPANFVNDEMMRYAVEQDKGSPEVIGLAKHRAILGLIEGDRSTAHCDYQHEWRGDIWDLRYTAVKLSNDEVMLLCQNLKSRQREYWLDYAARQ